MPTSAERCPDRVGPQAGFTLLEIMVVVGLLGMVILPILGVREQSSQRAYRSAHMSTALNYAEQLLADAMVMTQERDEYGGPIDGDPEYSYVLTLREFDLSTGLHLDEEADDALYQDDPDAALAYQPSDADTVPEEEDEERTNPHRVRRFSIEVFWPRWDAPEGEEDEESLDSVILEGFLPRYWEDEEDDEDDSGGAR